MESSYLILNETKAPRLWQFLDEYFHQAGASSESADSMGVGAVGEKAAWKGKA